MARIFFIMSGYTHGNLPYVEEWVSKYSNALGEPSDRAEVCWTYSDPKQASSSRPERSNRIYTRHLNFSARRMEYKRIPLNYKVRGSLAQSGGVSWKPGFQIDYPISNIYIFTRFECWKEIWLAINFGKNSPWFGQQTIYMCRIWMGLPSMRASAALRQPPPWIWTTRPS